MDDQCFAAACHAATIADKGMGGIGTLGERTLHMVLKRYMEPDESLHEIKVGGFVADIARPGGIVEIQTRDFSKLRRKLAAFLELGPVTVVYPVTAVKHLRWIDPATGEVGEAHKSPRRGALSDALPELYKIKPFVTHPNFTLCVAMLELEELRYQNGWSKDGKRGSERCDRIPHGLVDEVHFHAPEDYPGGATVLFFCASSQNIGRHLYPLVACRISVALSYIVFCQRSKPISARFLYPYFLFLSMLVFVCPFIYGILSISFHLLLEDTFIIHQYFQKTERCLSL